MKIKMVDVVFFEYEDVKNDLFIFSAISKKHRWYVGSMFSLYMIQQIPSNVFPIMRWAEMRHLRDKLEMELCGGNSDK